MRKTLKNKLLFGALATTLVVGCIGVGIRQSIAQELPTTKDELIAYYIDGSDSFVGHTSKDGTFESAPNSQGLKVSLANNDKLVLREVIDLNDYSFSDSLIKISVAPEVRGEPQVYSICVDLVDVYDENNFVTMAINTHEAHPKQDVAGDNSAYTLAKASNGQQFSGAGFVNIWGCWTGFFFGANEEFVENPEENFFAWGFDIGNSEVYISRPGGAMVPVVDLNDNKTFGEKVWDGFTTGEVYARVYCKEYQDSLANLVIQKYGEWDLTKEYEEKIIDEAGPILTVDYNGYKDSSLPTALVGKEYSLFDASAFDLYSGITDVDVNVYRNYFSSEKYSVPMNKRLNTFVPALPGAYYVEYSSKDTQGKETKNVLQVNAVKQTEEMSFAFEEHVTSIKNGEAFVLPNYELSGGSGRKSVSVSATNNGKAVAISNNEVRAFETGTLTVSYTATDYVGQTKTQEITINVVETDKPTFIELPTMPKYFIEGNRYNLPVIYAYNYMNGGTGEKIPTTITVKGKTSKVVLKGNVYVPSANTHGEVLEITYTATFADKESVLTYQIPVLKVQKDGRYDMSKFFVTEEGTSVTAENNYLEIATTKTNTSLDFANALKVRTATVEWLYNENSANIGKLSFLLQDYYDPTNQVKLTYSQGKGVYINDDEKNAYALPVGFSSGNLASFSYDNRDKQIAYGTTELEVLTVKTNMAGEPFEGFTNNTFHLTILLENCAFGAGFNLRYINNQFFSSSSGDWSSPVVSVIGTLGGDLSLGTRVELPELVVSDILSGEIDAWFTMRDPNGKAVRDVDGRLLENRLIVGDTYFVDLNVYGVYAITISGQDKSGNTCGDMFVLNVVDEQAPTITLSGEPVKEVTVGSSVIVPSAVATDNLDEEVELFVYIVIPSGGTQAFDCTSKGFKATRVGEYKIMYVAVDKAGNIAQVVHTVKVRRA